MSAPEWRAQLQRSERGIIKPTLSNAVSILQHDPMFSPERLHYDEFLDVILVTNSQTRPWRDDDDTRVTVYMQDSHGIHGMPQHLVQKAVPFVAKQRSRNVVRAWLDPLVWDGVARIAMSFTDHWGAADDEYTQAASRNFYIGIVARICSPGCKLDTMPVFEGPQGIKKSSALQVLGGPWYSVAHESVGSKDFLQGFRGKLIIEIAELQSFSRADVTGVKNMLSSPYDDYRPSYGRVVVRYPRQCVMAGTTNADEWGTDETGLRRFWPIRCGEIRLDLLSAVRDQLFAEALAAFRAGATWWEMPVITADIQAERQQTDAWSEAVLGWCALQPTEDGLAAADILSCALKIPIDRIDKATEMRLGKIMRQAKWERRTRRVAGKPQKRWLVPTSSGNSGDVFSA